MVPKHTAVGLYNRAHENIDRIIALLLLAPASLLLAIEAVLSLRWRLGHDTSILLYVTYLIQQHGYVAYRDVFDFSLPGTLAFHYIIVKLFGYGDLGFMVFNLIWTGALLAVTWMIMRRFGWWVAWGSVVLFGVFTCRQGGRWRCNAIMCCCCP